MKNITVNTKKTVFKLACLWAFIEAGLGGFLHLFHIPVTGFIIGGFAIIIIVLISTYSGRHFWSVINALALVLAIKFILSPYSPPGAYIAVAFQGLFGAIIFSFIALNNITVIIFSIVVMLESALQKPLIAWLLLGNKFWKSVALYFEKECGLQQQTIESAFVVVLFIYLLLYILWGAVISGWANFIRKNIEAIYIDEERLAMAKHTISIYATKPAEQKKRFKFIFLAVLFAMVLAILIYTKLLSASYLLRILIVVFVVFFLIPYLIKKQQRYFISKNRPLVNEVLNTMPAVKNKVVTAYELVKPLNSFAKLKWFIIYAIWLNVFYNERVNA